MKKIFLIILMCSAFLNAQDSLQIILAGKLIDVKKGNVRNDVAIIVENSIIKKIEGRQKQYKNGKVIDLSNYIILPGLIDCHTHLTGNWYSNEFDPYTLPAASYGILGTLNAKKTLEAGFTVVRDLHSYFFADIALRDAINKEWIPGPKMYVSGPGISITGGHGAWGNWLSPQLDFKENPGSIADGKHETRQQTRKHLKYKVDVIKVFATGGFSSHGTIPGAASYTIEEMEPIVDEARKRGIKVAAHAHGAEGIKNAIISGIHSIEHAAYLNDESIRLMKEKKIFLVMDLLGAHYDLIEKNRNYKDKNVKNTNESEYKNYTQRFFKAYKTGVKIAFGTDSGVYPHGRNAEQFKLMTDAGMKQIDAIRSATIVAAELIGIEKNTGSIDVNKWADMIAVEKNPLDDISTLENVKFVMRGGKIYKWVK